MQYLVKTTETYRFETDEQAQAFLEEEKKNPRFTVKKSSCEKKEVKVKGEIVDEYIKCTVEKVFNDEKYPEQEIVITYDTAAFGGSEF